MSHCDVVGETHNSLELSLQVLHAHGTVEKFVAGNRELTVESVNLGLKWHMN